MIDRSPIRYHGGKWRIAQWVISHFPTHTTYVEPYCGGASVLFQKRPSHYEIINDLNEDVVNFFSTMRENPDELIRAIELTPYSRSEHHLSTTRLAPAADNAIERARRFYVRAWQSYGSGEGRTSTGWRYQVGRATDTSASAIRSFNTTDHLYAVALRLKTVFIENNPAVKVIQRYDAPRTLFYVDPPYVLSTRHTDNAAGKGYQHEMTDDQHRELATTLHDAKGMVLLSGNPSPLYNELFRNWTCVEIDARGLSNKPRKECLWLSPKAQALSVLPLFAGLES